MSWFLAILILSTSFWDGWRDTGITRVAPRETWHYVKWLSFYPPMLYLTWECSRTLMRKNTLWVVVGMVVLLAGASWLVWQLGHYISPWEPKL